VLHAGAAVILQVLFDLRFAFAFRGFVDRELDAVVVSRGWRVSASPLPPPEESLEHQMRQRGMRDAEIIAELAEIEAVTLERRAGTAA